jgi:hypothetical protein
MKDPSRWLLRRSLALAAFQAMETHENLERSRRVKGPVVDLGPSIKREQWKRENRWELSKEDLDMIAADIWGSLPEGTKRKNVKGAAPKAPPMPYRARDALAEINSAIARIEFELTRLSEPALKAIAFRAKQRARHGREDLVWNGIAALADYFFELEARRRRGDGKWFAVIEACRTFPGQEVGRIECIAFKECNSKRQAEEAARVLLADNAKHFSEWTDIDAKLYCDLEWSPEDADVYVWPVAAPKTDGEETIDDEESPI